jgi:hypothetical protein
VRRHPGEARIEIGGGPPARPFPPVLSRSFPGVTSERYKLASSDSVAFPGNQTGGTPFMFARRSVAEAEDTLAWIRAQLEPATDLADLKARPRCAVARCDRSKHRMFGRAAPRRAAPRPTTPRQDAAGPSCWLSIDAGFRDLESCSDKATSPYLVAFAYSRVLACRQT